MKPVLFDSITSATARRAFAPETEALLVNRDLISTAVCRTGQFEGSRDGPAAPADDRDANRLSAPA
jgi:hypothetical protein